MENIDGMLVLVDFQKAFDYLSWDYMEYVLNKFCFPEYIVSWVKIVYNDKNQACVLNNGWKSDFFNIQRGVKQGDPLSPLLYIICGEILTNAIKHYKAIRGIDMNGFNSKILQYADDTCITIQKDERSLYSVFTILKDFEKKLRA